MERKPSDESFRQIEHVSSATKKSVLRFTYRETPTLSSMSSRRSESQRFSRILKAAMSKCDLSDSWFMLAASRVASCLVVLLKQWTMTMILSKRKGKWRTSGTGGWVKTSHSKSFLFCRGGQLLLWPASGNHHASKQDLRYARVSVKTTQIIQC